MARPEASPYSGARVFASTSPTSTRLGGTASRASAATVGGSEALTAPSRSAYSARPGTRRVVQSPGAGGAAFCAAVFPPLPKPVCRPGGRSDSGAGRPVARRRRSGACLGVRARQRQRRRRHAACRRNGPRVRLRAARRRRRCRTAPNQRHAGGAHERGWGNASAVQAASSLLDRGRRGRAGQWGERCQGRSAQRPTITAARS